jgi:FkbM family methyltransferase
MKKILLSIFRSILHLYPKEHGKYTILNKLYYPYLAPKGNIREDITIFNGMKMNVNPTESLQAYLYVFGSYELPTIHFLEKALKSGNNVLDIGAQVGYTALVFSKIIGANGKIFAFEPERANYASLQKNLGLNNISNVKTFKKAVAETAKSIRLYLSNDNNAGSHSTVFNDRTLKNEFEEVEAITVDSMMPELPKISCIKIDVEGAEIDVITGAKELLKRDSPFIIAELSAELQKLRGLSVQEFKERLFKEFGYSPFMIEESGLLKSTPLDSFHFHDNVVFLPNHRIQEFGALIEK